MVDLDIEEQESRVFNENVQEISRVAADFIAAGHSRWESAELAVKEYVAIKESYRSDQPVESLISAGAPQHKHRNAIGADLLKDPELLDRIERGVRDEG